LVAIEAEIENVRAAWRHWVSQGNLGELRKLADCLWLLCDARGWYHAMVDSTSDLLNVLASTPSTPERAQQEILLRISLARALMAIKGCTPEVEEAYTRALELCQGEGEIPQLLLLPRRRGASWRGIGRHSEARDHGRSASQPVRDAVPVDARSCNATLQVSRHPSGCTPTMDVDDRIPLC
jgi:hypothetical protein